MAPTSASTALAGQQPDIDLSAGLVPKQAAQPVSQDIDLSAGLVPKAAPVSIDPRAEFGQDVIKAVSGPNTAIGSPLSPALSTEFSGVSDIAHGDIRQGLSKVWQSEQPHIIPGSPIEKMIQAINPDFHGAGGTPAERATAVPFVDVAQFIDQKEHPIGKALAEIAQSATSPESISIMIATGGLGMVDNPVALAQAHTLMNAGFSAFTIAQAYKHLKNFKEAYDKGDASGALYQLTLAVASGVISGLAAHAAVTGTQIPVASDLDKKVGNAVAEGGKEIAASVTKVPADIKSGIEDYFDDVLHPDADEAAQKGLKPSKRKAIKAQQDLQGARPYLESAEDLADLQKKTDAAKKEIWAPMTKVIEGPTGDIKVIGPDGSATVRELEAERLKTRAELDNWQSLQPTDRQVQLQKDGKIKELTERYEDITDAMDPELEKAGINPKLIRKTFGQVQGVNKLLQGRNTLSEAAQKYGLAKIFNIDLTHPLNSIPNITGGISDILAGRPTFSGKPTDVNIKEGFREGTGGAKPNLAPGVKTTPTAKPTAATSGPATPANPVYAYRARNVGETGIPGSKTPSATMSLEDAQKYAEGREGIEGKPQEIVKVDLSKTPHTQVPGPRGNNFVHFNGTEVPESALEVVKPEAAPESVEAKAATNATAAVAGAAANAPAQAVPEKAEAQTAEKEPEEAPDVNEILKQAAFRHGIPLALLAAQANQESKLDPGAVSKKGAVGVMQLMPHVAKSLGVDDLTDPEQNIEGGTALMNQLHKRFGRWDRALAAYNWSPDKVQNAIKLYGSDWLKHTPKETQNYVKSITQSYIAAKPAKAGEQK